MSDQPTVEEYLRARPTDEETAFEAVDRYRNLTPAQRIEALADLLASMDRILAGRKPLRSPEDEDFWRHWVDPSLGCPR